MNEMVVGECQCGTLMRKIVVSCNLIGPGIAMAMVLEETGSEAVF